MTDILGKMEYANDSVDANKLNAIYAANPSLINLPEEAKDANSKDCSSSSHVDFLYLSTIRGGRKMSGEINGGCGCGMKGGGGDSSVSGYTGGCFTCKKGVKNIVHIYSTLHIVIPSLYKKYKATKKTKVGKVKVV
uniref:Uncharacterized protein n=1 Tax=viral metagenome TaxID=1070528 RepID=A0A6C0LFR5_9ZZZZ